MGSITWNTNINAPCCLGEIVNNDACQCNVPCNHVEQTILIQNDFDCPSVASVFGWSIRDVQVMQARYYGVSCDHNKTDGTVDCPDCGLTADTFIKAAIAWLHNNNGAIADDPGYFYD